MIAPTILFQLCLWQISTHLFFIWKVQEGGDCGSFAHRNNLNCMQKWVIIDRISVTLCWAFVVWVWVSASQKIPLFWRKTHTNGLSTRFSTRPEGRFESQQKWTEETIQQKEAEQRSWQNRAVDRSRGKPTARMCGTRAGLVNVKRWVSFPGGFVGISLEYTLAIAHRILGKCHKLLPSCAWSYPSPCLFVLFSPTILVKYVVFCVSVKKCEILLTGDERNH